MKKIAFIKLLNDFDTYKTILKASEEALFKDRGSKFYGYAFPVRNEEEINTILQDLKEKHHKARHWCYAWKIGVENERYRVNDDGEPKNSAGQPIIGQIRSFDLTDVLIVVVRYFGGTKLGVGGLINAYRNAAQMSLDNSEIIKKTIDVYFQIEFGYEKMDKVMRLIKEKDLKIVNQEMEMQCNFTISTRKKNKEMIENAIKEIRDVKITLL